jgi:predicted dehydrogenase
MERLKVAVIGLGKMGILHTSILSTMPNVCVVAVCDKKKIIVRFVKKILGGKVQVVDDVSLLSAFDLDAVYVTTHIPSHFKLIKSVYADNIASNVFVEKTLASSYAEAEELCRLSEKFGGVNMVGFQKRHSVTFRKAHELLIQGTIGEPSLFEAYAYSSDFIGFKSKDIRRASISRGGVLRDLGAHAIDLALWFFGNLEIISHEVNPDESERFYESVRFAVRGSNGVEGLVKTSWCKEGYRMPEVGLRIEGSKGLLFVNDDKVEVKLVDGTTKKWYRHNLNDNVYFLLGAPEFYREDCYFVACARDGKKSITDFFTASKVDYVIEQIYRAQS